MNLNRFTRLSVVASAAIVSLGLSGCLQGEANKSEENTVAEEVNQVSAQLDKPYLLDEKGEVISSIEPEILAAIKEDLRSQAKLGALSDLETLFDPATGKLKDANRLSEIQFQADNISLGRTKGAAR
jgi:hypothetical protein